jgi:3-oxoacyl-[acyl-carrier-protein] synthase-1
VYSSVGHTAEQTHAALRCRLNNFSESAFFDRQGGASWVAAADVPPAQVSSVARQIFMLRTAIAECLAGWPPAPSLPLILCLGSRSEREAIVSELAQSPRKRLHVVAEGASGLGHALAVAADWLADSPQVLLAAVDSYATAERVNAMLGQGWALTEFNGDGVVPGEAACALLLARSPDKPTQRGLDCVAFTVTQHDAVRGGKEPNLGLGLSKAIALATQSMPSSARIAVRISDQAGDEWHATQASLGAGRAGIGDADLWCTADSLGYCGAASGPLALAWAQTAVLKGYAPAGFMLCHQSSLAGQHAAVLLRT